MTLARHPVKEPLRKVNYKIVPFGAGTCPNTSQCASLHAELLPRSPLTKLGTGFMERYYYKILPRQGYIFGAVAYVDGSPAGFVSATYDSDGFLNRSVTHNLFRLMFVGLTTFPTPKRIEGAIEAFGIFKTREPKGKWNAPDWRGPVDRSAQAISQFGIQNHHGY